MWCKKWVGGPLTTTCAWSVCSAWGVAFVYVFRVEHLFNFREENNGVSSMSQQCMLNSIKQYRFFLKVKLLPGFQQQILIGSQKKLLIHQWTLNTVILERRTAYRKRNKNRKSTEFTKFTTTKSFGGLLVVFLSTHFFHLHVNLIGVTRKVYHSSWKQRPPTALL